ncbi:PEP-CTERM sorting domain-containing protein [Pseudoduganella sp. RAF53_2]|uniref:PEP-CTERM sorting domain-containing protein n=1 Tax=unclassified Pseudoduganella TaxID=2637179 RepID=UPI003F979A99
MKQLKNLAAALCLAAAPLAAFASPLGLDWTVTHTGDMYNGAANSTTDTSGDLLVYGYTSPGSHGVFNQHYEFTTVAADDGVLNLELDWSSFAAWYHSYTSLYLKTDDGLKLLSTNNWANHDKIFTSLNVTAGQTWGFVVDAGNNDLNGSVNGFLGVNAVPEPISLALFGLGAAALGAARRRRAV